MFGMMWSITSTFPAVVLSGNPQNDMSVGSSNGRILSSSSVEIKSARSSGSKISRGGGGGGA